VPSQNCAAHHASSLGAPSAVASRSSVSVAVKKYPQVAGLRSPVLAS
jgi:hypothetical protein